LEKRNGNKTRDSTNGHRYVFDDFEIDPANRLCLRAGHPVPLTARVFDILVVFAENPGRLLKKNELIANVWRQEFVEEANLSRNISTLRRALGDGSNGHKYIVTVPGHGYRFVATVAEVAAPVPESAPDEEIKPPRQTEPPAAAALPAQKLRGFQLGQKTAFIMILFAVVGAVVYLRWAGKLTFGKASKAAILFENIKLRNLTNSGDVYAPVISPDGKYLAYSSGPKLRVRQLASGRVIEIPTPITSPGVRYWAVLFSADSNYVYFTIADDGENISGTLFRVPVLGGRAEKILDHVNSGGHESPDGKHLVFVRADVNAGKSHLMISNTDGTNQQSISTIDMNSLFGSLDWAPDSSRILYAFRQHTAGGYIHYVAEIPFTGGAEVRIVQPRRDRILAAKWLPSKSGLIMSAIDPATRMFQLYYVTYPGAEEYRVTNDLADYRSFNITADGRTLIAQHNKLTTRLWLASKNDPGHAVTVASSTSGWFQGISWASDDEILYNSDENGLLQICKMNRDGSEVQQLTQGPGQKYDPSVTSDGRFIAFVSTRSGSSQIWRMNADGNDPVQLTNSDLSVFKPQRSPDGQWVYYGVDAHGKWQLRKVPMAGGDEIVVEDRPVDLWSISPDGKMLAYSFFDERQKKTRVALRQLDRSQPIKYFDISPSFRLEWTRDGRALTYIDANSGEINVWLQPLDGSSPHALTALSPDEWIATFAWSPDGKTLAYTRINTSFDAALIELR